ncbi:hypothetical protein COU57_02660 [Candidatus Pacearchaeota archaeon CG10_big_fil_rev_8_21_14_0_10_32_14]|nr:MAG: hypothetical protein COU57_02660 [Candidatus Pacearchaeota archaeon CG10_big_fil_rev_8_21_14_0_10_32_14]
MLNFKEFMTIIFVSIVLAFTLTVLKKFENYPFVLLAILIIILVNVFAKKIAAFFLETEVDIRLWEITRYGFKSHHRFKRNFPAGLIFPIVFTIFSVGFLQWMASLVFDVKVKTYRAAKRHGLYRFSEITEDHIGYIAAAGIFANILLAIIAYFIGLPQEMNFVVLSIYFIFFNMIPVSDLDGNKILFGNMVLWAFLATLSLISIIAVFMVI